MDSPPQFATTSTSTTRTVREGAKALISTPRRTLLIKEQHSDGTPFWTLPGGGIRPDESPSNGLIREIVEELQCRPLITEEVAAFWYSHLTSKNRVTFYTVFESYLLSDPSANRKEGVLDWQWVSPDDPPVSTLPQVRYILTRIHSSSILYQYR